MSPWKEKREIGSATLYLGDAREIIPALDLAPDAVITDPVWPNCPAGLLAGSDDPYALWAQMCAIVDTPRLVAVLRHDSDPRFLAPVRLPFFRAQILPYVIPGYIGRKLGGDEIAYCFGEPVPSRPGRRVIPGYAPKVQPGARNANGHPCSRALAHFEFLVHWWSDPGEIVLDPFMGSGTTGAACLTHGRHFVGIETEPVFYEIACKRLEAHAAQVLMFDEAGAQ